jgi:mRNA interferase RelE/StbE
MYEVFLATSAVKALRKIDRKTAVRIARNIQSLAQTARPQGCRKIVGAESSYRIRIGDYRIVYEIDDANLRVNVRAVGHRRDIYRN